MTVRFTVSSPVPFTRGRAMLPRPFPLSPFPFPFCLFPFPFSLFRFPLSLALVFRPFTTIHRIFIVPSGLLSAAIRIVRHGHYDTPSSRNQAVESLTREAGRRARTRFVSGRSPSTDGCAIAIHSFGTLVHDVGRHASVLSCVAARNCQWPDSGALPSRP